MSDWTHLRVPTLRVSLCQQTDVTMVPRPERVDCLLCIEIMDRLLIPVPCALCGKNFRAGELHWKAIHGIGMVKLCPPCKIL